MSALEVRHLKLIKAIIEVGNVTRAAEKLCLTQPALSRQLADLEKQLETRLFHRTKKKMIPTRVGKMLFETAVRVLGELSRTEAEIAKLVHGETGILKIGTTCVLSYKWLPGIMKDMKGIYPKVEMELKTSPDVIDDLMSGQLDVVITTMADSRPGLRVQPIFKDEIVIVIAPDDPLNAKPFFTPSDFESVHLISYTDPVKGDLYRQYLAPAGIEPAKRIVAEHPDAAVELVKSGFGITLIPLWAVEGHIKSGALCARSFTRQGIYFQWAVISLKARIPPKYQDAFVQMIIDRNLAPTA